MKIPIQNVYYLLCYAWDKVPEAETVEVGREGLTELQDLFGHVLAEGVGRLIRRGLDRDYLSREEELAGVRGRLDLTGTLKRVLEPQARTVCEFDELRHDVLHNQILKTTLRNLLGLRWLDDDVRDRVGGVFRRLEGVSTIRLTRKHFGSVQLHRNNRYYEFLLDVCAIVHDNILIDEESGVAHFRDFRADERQMGTVFEHFVFNFLSREQDEYRVSRPHIAWDVGRASDANLARLPTMRTDVVLQSSRRRIILDTKFYSEALKGRFEAKKVDSGHLYQIFAYVKNRQAEGRRRSDREEGPWVDGIREGERAPRWEGMLLYPVVDDAFAFSYVLGGHPVQVRSIDLDQPWQGIHRDLLALVN